MTVMSRCHPVNWNGQWSIDRYYKIKKMQWSIASCKHMTTQNRAASISSSLANGISRRLISFQYKLSMLNLSQASAKQTVKLAWNDVIFVECISEWADLYRWKGPPTLSAHADLCKWCYTSARAPRQIALHGGQWMLILYTAFICLQKRRRATKASYEDALLVQWSNKKPS